LLNPKEINPKESNVSFLPEIPNSKFNTEFSQKKREE